MTIDTGTAVAAVDRGVTVAVDPGNSGTVDARVAFKAEVFMDSTDCVTGVAIDTKS